MQLVATSTPSAVAPKPTGTAHDRLSRTISAANVGVLTQIVTNMDSIPDAAHVTPAALVAGIDVAAYASTVSDALRSAHAVAPWSKPLLPAAEQAVQGVAQLLAAAANDTTVIGEAAVLAFINSLPFEPIIQAQMSIGAGRGSGSVQIPQPNAAVQ